MLHKFGLVGSASSLVWCDMPVGSSASPSLCSPGVVFPDPETFSRTLVPASILDVLSILQ